MLELNTNLLAEIGGWPALKEARVLVERGKVSEAHREGAIIRARVQGAEKVYNPQITLADRVANVEVRCTCAESRRRVCPHILAAGLAVLQGGGRPPLGTAATTTAPSRGPATATEGRGPLPGGRRLPRREASADGDIGGYLRKVPRYLLEEAPAGTPSIEVTVLLPLQLKESFAKDPVRIILEARRGSEGMVQPWDAAMGNLGDGFAVTEEDDRLLNALEQIVGEVKGINAVPRNKMGRLLHALGDHPRVWLGKKHRVEVRASSERGRIILSMRPEGGLEMTVIGRNLRDAPPPGTAAATTELPISGWSSDGARLIETPSLPAGFSSDMRVISVERIPDFLTREFSALERNCEIAFAPGFSEFQLEIGQPAIEARLEGALSGLTLDLVARYGGQEFSLSPKTESSAYQRYLPDARQPNRFWRRNVLAERAALAEVEAAGFDVVRSGATVFSLTQENQVARFLANTLPRWKRIWTVNFGARLEATMQQVDIAEPEFSLRSGSGEDWLSLDLKLSVGGKPVPLDQAEIQRWLQTGQSHGRMGNKRTLLVPTEAWGEMREVLADCAVDQEPGQIRVERKFAPFLAGALTAQGFRALQNVGTDLPVADVRAGLDAELWKQLRPYQARGVEWMAGLAQQNLHGLLADDMGLGKTLQALAFCAWLKGDGGAMELRRQSRSQMEFGNEGKSLRSNREGRTEKMERAMELHGQGRSQTPAEGSKFGNEGSGGKESTVARSATATEGNCALVVCPTSLVTNWLREAARFVPELRTLDLTGADRAERFATRHEYDLLVTSYAILRRDIELYRADEFSLVILDEAQHIKNRGSQNAQSAKALRARHRLILTGTPLENSVLDLWSLYDFLLPGYLGTAAEFKERYETPLTKEVSPKVMERLRHRVKPFFLRRTKEEVLTELPPKLEHLTLCELTDEQREVYKAVLAQGRRTVFEHSGKQGGGRDRIAVLTTLLRLRQVCCHLDLLPGGGEVSHGGLKGGEEGGMQGEGFARRTEERGGGENARRDFARRTEEGGRGENAGGDFARRTEERGRGENARGDFARRTEERGRGENAGGDFARRTEERGRGENARGDFARRTEERGRGENARGDFARRTEERGRGGFGEAEGGPRRWREPSAKMERTFELIDEAMDGGHRVLLFSQFVRVLHLLRDEAMRRGMSFCYLDGQTVERQAEVDRFQNDASIPIFFISLKAGGTGLNLTGADTVIHFDPWWNPAVEEQATSRAHRMGQSRRVQAYKLIAAGTVEEKIQALQARKRELFEASLGGDAAFVEKLTGEDLEELLGE